MKITYFTANHAMVITRMTGWTAATALFATLCVSSWAFGAATPNRHYLKQNPRFYGHDFSNENTSSYVIAYRDQKAPHNKYDNLSNEEKRKMAEKYKKWQDLPPGEKKKLRKRMNQWRNMSPQEQKKYRNRFQQWQNLTPQEREKYQKRLNNWESLTPQEKERLRREFQK
jgi:Protein of unknown function (DUF3106)